MHNSTNIPLLLVTFASATLTACGGGGGGGDPPAPAYESWTAAQATATGLVAPSQIVKTFAEGDHGARTNVNEAVLEFERAPKIAASRQLAFIYFGATGAIPSGPTPCPEGGSVLVFESVPAETPRKVMYQYSGCTVGGYTLTGGNVAGATGSSSSLKMDANGLGYVVNHANIAASGPGLLAGDTLDATSSCTLPATGPLPVCVTTFDGRRQWGKDFKYEAGKVNGTFRNADPNLTVKPNIDATHNITYTDFGSTSGVATTFGTNGYAVLTRTSSLTFDTLTTADGRQAPLIKVVCTNPSCNLQ